MLGLFSIESFVLLRLYGIPFYQNVSTALFINANALICTINILKDSEQSKKSRRYRPYVSLFMSWFSYNFVNLLITPLTIAIRHFISPCRALCQVYKRSNHISPLFVTPLFGRAIIMTLIFDLLIINQASVRVSLILVSTR